MVDEEMVTTTAETMLGKKLTKRRRHGEGGTIEKAGNGARDRSEDRLHGMLEFI